MTRHYRHKLTINPETHRLGYWLGDMVNGEIVDTWHDACHAHPLHNAVDCELCASRPTEGAADATT